MAEFGFGNPLGNLSDKTQLPLEDRIKYVGFVGKNGYWVFINRNPPEDCDFQGNS